MHNSKVLSFGKSGCTGLPKLPVHQVAGDINSQVVTMHRHGTLGLELPILLKVVSNTTEEVLSNFHGTTTTELSPKQSMRVHTTAI